MSKKEKQRKPLMVYEPKTDNETLQFVNRVWQDVVNTALVSLLLPLLVWTLGQMVTDFPDWESYFWGSFAVWGAIVTFSINNAVARRCRITINSSFICINDQWSILWYDLESVAITQADAQYPTMTLYFENRQETYPLVLSHTEHESLQAVLQHYLGDRLQKVFQKRVNYTNGDHIPSGYHDPNQY